MIVKISGSGKSFKGLAQYLTHDPKAETNERVAWTHTHNLANDDVACAVNEMYLTAENAELLKQEAGVRAGGRRAENTVKHVSLNWAPADNPSQDHMIKSGNHFLETMGWGDHQAMFVGHSDKSYKHLHIILNATHPETGLHLNESYENARAQAWAAQYERSQDCIRCPQRLQDPAEREKAMPRNMWVAFQQNEKAFSRAEEFLRENSENNPDNIQNSEWKILKDYQRSEREQFFADGKSQFSELRNSIYQTVREEFRGRWNDYYEARRNGGDAGSLRELKQGIIADQTAALEPRREAACQELREQRDTQYRGILDTQQEQRQTLRWHQDLGLDTSDFFNQLHTSREADALTEEFHEASLEVTGHRPALEAPGERTSLSLPAAEIVDSSAGEVGSFSYSILDFAFSEWMRAGSARPEPVSKVDREESLRITAEDLTKRREQSTRELDEEEQKKKSKAYSRE